jgi:hypothetical protein
MFPSFFLLTGELRHGNKGCVPHRLHGSMHAPTRQSIRMHPRPEPHCIRCRIHRPQLVFRRSVLFVRVLQIAIENENDLKLYAFANRLLDCRLSRCGKERMRWSAHVHNGEHGAQEPHAGPHFFANANIAAKRMLDG